MKSPLVLYTALMVVHHLATVAPTGRDRQGRAYAVILEFLRACRSFFSAGATPVVPSAGV